MREIESVTLVKKVRVKRNSKPWFETQIISAIQKRDKQCSRYNKSELETDKGNFKITKTFLQKMRHRKKILI